MAKAFIYPHLELFTATKVAGTHDTGASPVFTVNAAALTDEERAFDQSIGKAVTGWVNEDTIRIDFGAAVSLNAIAIYFNSIETSNMILYGDSVSTGNNKVVFVSMTADFVAGWNVFDVGTSANRYWFIKGTGSIDGLTEIILGKKYDFDVNFPTGDDEYDRPNVDVIKSWGAQEYANKRADLQRVFNWRWEIPTVAMRTSLRAVDTAVQKNFLKFIYDDETSKYWVRMSADSLKFKRVHFDYWETNVKLTQQLI